jgi:hypothetical protein
MKEMIIHIPVNYNDGKVIAKGDIAAFERMLLLKAGGFSTHLVNGAWVAPNGEIIKETMQRYIVAGDDITISYIAERLPEFCALYKQDCLYVVIDGNAQFINAD